MSVASAIITGLAASAAILTWTSFKFEKTNSVAFQMAGQLFHILSMILCLGMVYTSYYFVSTTYAAATDVYIAIMNIFVVTLAVYIVLMVAKYLWNLWCGLRDWLLSGFGLRGFARGK